MKTSFICSILRLLTVFLVTPVLPSSARCAQNGEGPSAQIGFLLGGNRSTIEYANPEYLPFDDDAYRARVTYRIGPLLRFAVYEALSLRSGLVLDVRGNKVVFDTTIATIEDPWTPIPARSEVLTTRHYLVVPVQAVVHLAKEGARPYLLGGPEVGFLLRDRISFDTRGGGIHQSGSGPPAAEHPSIDYGFDVGLGCEFPVHGLTGFLELSYFWGFKNLNESSNGEEHRYYNRVGTLSAGIWL